MESLRQDLRFGLRMLVKNPGFTAIAVGVLALGIGANSAIFSVVYGVLMRPLPYRAPQELVTLLHEGRYPVSPADFLDWKNQSRTFEDMAAAELWGPTVTGREQPERIVALRATSNIFRLLGNRPVLGRTFLTHEDAPGNENVVVLSHGLWQRRFGGDRSVSGRVVTLDGRPYTVIGVMPPEFQFAPYWATGAEMWAPLPLAERAASRRGRSLRIFARLKPAVSLSEAQSEMNVIAGNLANAYPESNSRLTVTVVPLLEKVVGEVKPALLILLAAVAFVLLITCANVAALLLARASTREREIAIRTALGAGRVRLARQFLTESLLLALGGGLLGVLLARLGVRLLVALGPADVPRLSSVSLDPVAVGFTAVVALALGLVFGLAPALRASRVDFSDALKEGGRGVTEGRRRSSARSFLVVFETALAIVLLISAALMIRSFVSLQQVDPGFEPRNLLSMVVSVAGSREAEPERRGPFFKELVSRIRNLPGVESASAINHLPLAGDIWTLTVSIEGRPVPLPSERTPAAYRVVLPEYFRTMGIRLVKGRDFDDRDVLQAPDVVVINESLARSQWPGENPIGKRITYGEPGRSPWRTIVGIVQDVKQREWSGRVGNEICVPYLQDPSYLNNPAAHYALMTLVIRTAPNPATLVAATKAEVWSLNKNLPVSDVLTLEQVVSNVVARPRFNTLLLGMFAVLALILAAMGMYGLISYTVDQRSHEIGVRMALGARQRDVLWMVLSQGLTLASVGIAVGLPAALFLTRFLSKILYGVSPHDPLSFAFIPIFLLGVTFAATYIPARRAAGVDPVEVLRHD
jgi:putative ABC transport system permease protein